MYTFNNIIILYKRTHMFQTNGIIVVVDVAVVVVSVVVLTVVSLISSSYVIEIFISLPNRCSIATNIAIPLQVWVKLARCNYVTNTLQTRYNTLQTRYNTLQTRYKHDTNTSQTRYKHVTNTLQTCYTATISLAHLRC